GALDIADLDENDLATDSESPSTKKARKEEEQEDAEDLDDFMPENGRSTSKVPSNDIDERQTENTPKDRIISPLITPTKPTTSMNSSQFTRTQKPKHQKPARSHNGMEDVFTHAQVRSWSEVRIKTWEHRRTNTEGFYYRFVDPTEGQQNGPWSPKSTREFMARLEEWKARGIRIGTSWGIFSMQVSHKAGYQCSSYYRKLLETKKLMDPSYAWEGGKLVMVNKSSGGEMAVSGLSERWDTEEVKEIEANINRWIKEYHSNTGSRPVASKSKKIDLIAPASGSNAGSSRSGISTFRPTAEAPRVKATTVPAVPKALSLRPSKLQPLDESEMLTGIDINDKLAEYSSFMRPVRVECPDVPRVIIPKDVEQRPTWAHRIQPYTEFDAASVEGFIFKEVPKMIEFDWASLSEGFDEPISDIQGVLADPPWNFIVEDGRNDGACQLTTQEFGTIMEKALELMPNGIVSIWTHKAILPEVVAIMQSLGCRYVENLVWYKIALNNTNLDRASPYFRSSKEILLMFKKGDGFDIRHQRTADVIMDFEKPTSSWIQQDYTEPKPEGTFEMMEILLPDARYTPETGRGRLLELWAKKSQERRSGWLSVHELKCLSAPSDISTTPNDNGDDSIDEALLVEIANDMDLDQL
ncbi:hypothetical protein BGZ46_009478, partial [Entomortierella lignicola]